MCNIVCFANTNTNVNTNTNTNMNKNTAVARKCCLIEHNNTPSLLLSWCLLIVCSAMYATTCATQYVLQFVLLSMCYNMCYSICATQYVLQYVLLNMCYSVCATQYVLQYVLLSMCCNLCYNMWYNMRPFAVHWLVSGKRGGGGAGGGWQWAIWWLNPLALPARYVRPQSTIIRYKHKYKYEHK